LKFFTGKSGIWQHFFVERSGTSLYKILQSLKSYMAREANKLLNRSGAFWQHESYDHVVRDGKEPERIVSYVLYNPVKTGLVSSCDQYVHVVQNGKHVERNAASLCNTM
jgi:hypothetical protein